MNNKSRKQLFACLFALALLLLIEYGPSFNFYFVGDDFAFIDFVLSEKAAILWKSSCFYHYYPLGLIINSLPACFGWFDPKWFVGINFLFFFGCSTLIMVIYDRIVGGLAGGFLAALVYVTAVPNSEVIYWKTGNQTIAMAFFSLLSLLFFIRHVEKGSWKAFVGCAAAFIASMLSIEQGVVTFEVLFLYDLILWLAPQLREAGTGWKQIGIRFLRRQFLLLLIPVLLTALKSALRLQLSPFSLESRKWWMVPGMALDTMAKLFDFNNLVFRFAHSQLAFTLAVFSILLIFIGYILIRKSSAALFFFLTALGSILTISVAAGGPNLRYFCLPLAFFCCFLSLFVKDIATLITQVSGKGLARIRNVSGGSEPTHPWLCAALYSGLLLIVAFAGFRDNLARRGYWETASRIQRNMVESIEDLYLSGALRSGQKLYLLNIPEDIWSKKFSVFYVASNSLIPDMRRRVGAAASGIEPIATGTFFETDVRGERVAYRALGCKDNKVEGRDIERLVRNGETVLWFSPATQMLTPLAPHP